MKRFVFGTVCIALTLVLVLSSFPGLAESRKLATQIGSNQIQINNNTGSSITEVYLYPNYSVKVGDKRNKAWIRKQESGIITITAIEANRDCLWNMTVIFKPQNSYAFKVTWEDLELSNYLGHVVEFTITDNNYIMMSLVDQVGEIEFSFYNDTGYTISELYFYPANSTTWGQTRNTKAINDQGSVNVKFNSVESSSSAQWTMRALFPINGYVYYIEFEDVDLISYNGGTMVLSIDRDGNLYYYRYDGML